MRVLLRRRWRVTAVQLDAGKGPMGAAPGTGVLAPEVGQLAELQALELPGLGCARLCGAIVIHSCLKSFYKLRSVAWRHVGTESTVVMFMSSVQIATLPGTWTGL